jgi:hypothetical protein
MSSMIAERHSSTGPQCKDPDAPGHDADRQHLEIPHTAKVGRRHWLSQEGLCQHGIGAEEIKNKRKRFLHKPRQGPQVEQLPLHELVAASWSRYPERPVVADS